MSVFDIKNILSSPTVYGFFSNIVASSKTYSIITKEYIKPNIGDKILDIGCGICRILNFLPRVEYFGFDTNNRYIKAAKNKYGNRGTFVCDKINDDLLKKISNYDIVLALCVLHHLDDSQALQLFEIAKTVLKIGGRLITLDNCYIENQSKLARWFMSQDRGKYVRTREDYINIASKVFTQIETHNRNDLLRIPYDHIIIQCTA